jgi:hypothetical protein
MQLAEIYHFGHLLLAIAELLLVGWSVRLWEKFNNLAIILLLIILTSIIYDNVVLVSSNWLGDGELLMYLNKIRFFVHYLFLPLLIVVGVDLASRAGALWANSLVQRLSWVLAIFLGILDIVIRYTHLTLKSTTFAGITRYTDPNLGIPIVTIAVNFFMLLIGIGILVRSKGKLPWLFAGTLVAFLGNSLPSCKFGTLPASLSEFLMILSLLVTEYYMSIAPFNELVNKEFPTAVIISSR